MPRIEIKPENHPKDEATPTIDVCKDCAECFVEGEPPPMYIIKRWGGKTEIVTLGVEHPPYSEGDKGQYGCDRCGDTLTDADNDADYGTIEVRKL